MDTVIVIRAGGFGTRLWPKSRRSKPKQFLVLYGEKTLLQYSYERALRAVKDPLAIYVSVQEKHVSLVLEQIPITKDHLIVEPSARNTGPAICLETVFLQKRCSPETCVLTMPSDDFIGNEEAFKKVFEQGRALVKKESASFFTVAIPMTGIDTGFSYMSGKKRGDVFEVTSWIEKPDIKTCQMLLEQKTHFTHIGLYMWKLGHMYSHAQRVASSVMQASQAWVETGDKAMYEALEKVSVEKLLIQKSDTICFVVADDLQWQDVGTWSRLERLISPDPQGNVLMGKGILKNSQQIFLHGKEGKSVVVSGLTNIAIIDTDDVLYVCPKSELDQVQKTVESLEKEQYEIL